jgi:mevalonate kinase
LKLSVGSKVFIMGEYLALSGGPAVLAAFDPRFQLSVEKGTGLYRNISIEGPGGIFINKNKSFFSQYNLDFFDPFNGRGGWGASSAQYAMLAAFYYGQDSIQSDAQMNLDLQKIDKSYLEITSQNINGMPPSGMDVIAQLRGGLVFIDRNKGRIDNIVWPFSDVSFLMFATGVKVPTHLHLSTLCELPNSELLESVQKFNEAVMNIDKKSMVESINEFRKILYENNLEAPTTSALINKLKPLNGVLAAKGCGAMGADVIMLLVDKSEQNTIASTLSLQGLDFIVSKDHLTGPIKIILNSKNSHVESEVSL